MNKIIAENLKVLRKKRNITQQALCDEILKQGLSLKRNTYTKYENGTRTIPYEVICKLAVYYSVSTDYILNLKQAPSMTDYKR